VKLGSDPSRTHFTGEVPEARRLLIPGGCSGVIGEIRMLKADAFILAGAPEFLFWAGSEHKWESVPVLCGFDQYRNFWRARIRVRCLITK
jgi:hypothetical protein